MLFTGRITANAEVRTIKGDKQVTNFTVALNQRYKTKAGEKKEKTAYVNCSYWVNPGLAVYLTKGAIVEISGWVEAQTWKNREGKVQADLGCAVDTVKLFGSNGVKPNDTSKEKKAEKKAVAAGGGDDDDLPF
ncbi:single-stranded DNA-binding protein [Mucilaginibacter sabulilitoris]|uniref:Single-stranded DNA-binding protein n=1 Tax=Mucilaginibacter sabulilitoris TaxID=1173583 RepID=A0ABZ0THK5_9SPHI|nr:single-stranded DNA-binding protein [Mucilaginibacter sabulilitoris]WPU91713.1 single-stranded DNA-binding protein [Mucilaginibacter sabulilitoris]